MNKEILNKLSKPFFLLVLLIMICTFLARSLNSSETLDEYAKKNPEIAYGTTSNDEDTPEAATQELAVQEANAHETNDTNESMDAYNTNKSQETDSEPITPANTTQDMVQNKQEEQPEMELSTERITYQPGFYYEPLNDSIKKRITGISYPAKVAASADNVVTAINIMAENEIPAVSYDELRFVSVLYFDFEGDEQEGELICNEKIAQDIVEIFYELYQNEYQIEQIRLIDEYNGDDTLSMLDNNTSCFNYRVVDGTDSLSKHAYGLAIDINPFYNPYIVFGRNEDGSDYISPAGSEVYADRSKNFAYKIDENDLCYRLFKEHGFTWGGNWNSCKDYQHFQKTFK